MSRKSDSENADRVACRKRSPLSLSGSDARRMRQPQVNRPPTQLSGFDDSPAFGQRAVD